MNDLESLTQKYLVDEDEVVAPEKEPAPAAPVAEAKPKEAKPKKRQIEQAKEPREPKPVKKPNYVGRFFLCLATLILMLVITIASACMMISYGPSPTVRNICNPEGIESPEAFFELFEKQFSEDKEPVVNEDEETQVDKDEDKEPETLFEILEANNVDLGSERIYVIFDNDDANCVIVFNKDGLFEIDTYPTLTAGKDYIMVGGAN